MPTIARYRFGLRNRQPDGAHPPFKRGYLPTLDGWRALAIAIVLLDHSPSLGHVDGVFSSYRFHSLGGFGVQLFFALSGLLITSRLLDEEAVTGSLHLKGFYIRRLARIQPAALMYLATVAALMLFHRLPPQWGALAAALLLVRNYLFVPTNGLDWPTVHFWSLSVEEHFYLVLPTFLRYIKKRRATVLLSLAAVDALFYVWLQARSQWLSTAAYFHTDACAHFLLFASGIAVLLRNERYRAALCRWLQPWWTVPLACLMVPFRSHLHNALFAMPSLLVLSTLLHPHGMAGRFLESAPLKFVGRISYSLYLWQELFMSAFWAPTLHPFGNPNRLWFAWGATFGMALLSYYLVEKPFIRLGHKLARPATPGRPL